MPNSLDSFDYLFRVHIGRERQRLMIAEQFLDLQHRRLRFRITLWNAAAVLVL